MSTQQIVLKVHPDDNVLVALANLLKDEKVVFEGQEYTMEETVKAKHKFATVDLAVGDSIIMYGVLVGKAQLVPVNFTPAAMRRDDKTIKEQFDPNNPNAGRGSNCRQVAHSKFHSAVFRTSR